MQIVGETLVLQWAEKQISGGVRKAREKEVLAPSRGCPPALSFLPATEPRGQNPSFHLPVWPTEKGQRWIPLPEALPATSPHTYFSCRMRGNSSRGHYFGPIHPSLATIHPGFGGIAVALFQWTGQQPGVRAPADIVNCFPVSLLSPDILGDPELDMDEMKSECLPGAT